MNKRKYLFVGIVVMALVLSTAGSLGYNYNVIKNDGSIVGKSFSVGAVLEVTTDKTAYCLGEPVTIFLTNVGDEILCAGGPIVTIFNECDEIIYEEGCYCYWELESGEYITWPSWDQTDKHGNQVPVGEYVVEGFLSDGGEGYVDTAIFFIIDNIPSGLPSGPTEGVVDVEYTFCIKLPDNPECEPYYTLWDWGDGMMSEWLGPYEAGAIVCVGYSWCEPGDYEIRVQIRDSCNNKYWSDTLTIHVIMNNPPNTPIIEGSTSGETGEEYTYCINVTDPDGDFIYVLWDWGDGTNTGWLGPYQSGKEICASHSWEKTGTFIIKVTIKDEYDAMVTASLKVTMTKDKIAPNNLIILRLLEYFPILQTLLQRFGL